VRSAASPEMRSSCDHDSQALEIGPWPLKYVAMQQKGTVIRWKKTRVLKDLKAARERKKMPNTRHDDLSIKLISLGKNRKNSI
jgi:hypothetical protein